MPVTISGTTGVQGNLQGNVVGNLTGQASELAPGGINNRTLITDLSSNDTFLFYDTTDQTLKKVDFNSMQPTGSILQVVTFVQNISSTLSSGTLANTGITPLTLTRRQSNSKILMELTGGRWTGGNTYGATYFYVSENEGPLYNPVTLGTTAVEYIYDGNGAGQGPHMARYVYTPSLSVNTISLSIYYITNGGGSYPWHTANTEPFVLTMTEIKG